MRKKTDFEAVIFDMDGLMFDTEPIYHQSWYEAASILGFQLEPDFFRETQGRNNKDAEELLIKYTSPTLDILRFREIWKEKWFDLGINSGIKRKKGLSELLDWLTINKIPAALATSSNREIMEFCIKETGLESHFSAMISGQEVNAGKPKPDIYLEAARRLNVKPEDCAVLEDSSSGAMAGISAGMLVFLVPDHTDPPAEVKKKVYMVGQNLLQVLAELQYIHD